MPNYVIYRTDNNRVVDYLISSPFDPTPPLQVGQSFVRDPNLSLLTTVERKYWKHSAGTIIEMTIAEKTALDAELAAANITSVRSLAKGKMDGFFGDPVLRRAMLLVMLDEINLLRAAVIPSLTPRTAAQIKTAILNKIDSGAADT